MKPLASLSKNDLRPIKAVLTDIDDTLTTDGRLTSSAYNALEALKSAGFIIIPVTGRCAGWCDHIARMWPVDAIVGENGAFYFRYDHASKTMHRHFSQAEEQRLLNAEKLQALRAEIESSVPGSAVASDQDYRICDLAVDVAEDVTPLSADEIKRIVALTEDAGAVAKISSIHVNCWFGEHSKLSASLKTLDECFGIDKEHIQNEVLFVGDSPNDATMFRYFDFSIGVANILNFVDFLTDRPTYITENCAGRGFSEIADRLLDARGCSYSQTDLAK